MPRPGLVAKKIHVRVKGKTAMRTYWVRPTTFAQEKAGAGDASSSKTPPKPAPVPIPITVPKYLPPPQKLKPAAVAPLGLKQRDKLINHRDDFEPTMAANPSLHKLCEGLAREIAEKAGGKASGVSALRWEQTEARVLGFYTPQTRTITGGKEMEAALLRLTSNTIFGGTDQRILQKEGLGTLVHEALHGASDAERMRLMINKTGSGLSKAGALEEATTELLAQHHLKEVGAAIQFPGDPPLGRPSLALTPQGAIAVDPKHPTSYRPQVESLINVAAYAHGHDAKSIAKLEEEEAWGMAASLADRYKKAPRFDNVDEEGFYVFSEKRLAARFGGDIDLAATADEAYDLFDKNHKAFTAHYEFTKARREFEGLVGAQLLSPKPLATFFYEVKGAEMHMAQQYRAYIEARDGEPG